MPKSAAARMAALRARQRASGLTTLSIVVPKADTMLFQELARERRRMTNPSIAAPPLRKRWLAAVDDMGLANPPIRPLKPAAPEGSAGRRRGSGRIRSQAERVMDQILKHVIRLRWPIGSSLGSEAELMNEYGVSRPVLRQAIRLLEHYGVARMQRGVAGGLVIDAPDASATARAVSVYLEFRRMGPVEILETRKTLEQATISLAVQRLTKEGESRLRTDIALEAALDASAAPQSWQRLHFTIADLCGDPALSLFAGIVLHLSEAHSNFPRRPKEEREKVVRRIKKLHWEIAETMIARDVDAACRLVGRYLDGYREWLE